MSCIKSGSVRRLIYTATVMAASPLTDGGSSFKDSMDESCWTPLNLSLPYETYTFVEVISYHFLALQKKTKQNKTKIPNKTHIYDCKGTFSSYF